MADLVVLSMLVYVCLPGHLEGTEALSSLSPINAWSWTAIEGYTAGAHRWSASGEWGAVDGQQWQERHYIWKERHMTSGLSHYHHLSTMYVHQLNRQLLKLLVALRKQLWQVKKQRYANAKCQLNFSLKHLLAPMEAASKVVCNLKVAL